jgi:hypothetical protein
VNPLTDSGEYHWLRILRMMMNHPGSIRSIQVFPDSEEEWERATDGNRSSGEHLP